MFFSASSFRHTALCSTALCLLFAANVCAATTAPTAQPGAMSKHDNSLPIEISSETLEVKQNENVAIFRGNVIAVQGDFRLKSDVMYVHYRQKTDTPANGSASAPPAPPPPPSTKTAPGQPASADSMGSITLIEVEGNVLMANPDESGRGDKGDYHPDTKILHLFGNNVILTKGKDILRGTALEYNMATGRSVLTHGGGNTDTNRVRGVFVPQNTKPGDVKSQTPVTDATQKTGTVKPDMPQPTAVSGQTSTTATIQQTNPAQQPATPTPTVTVQPAITQPVTPQPTATSSR